MLLNWQEQKHQSVFIAYHNIYSLPKSKSPKHSSQKLKKKKKDETKFTWKQKIPNSQNSAEE